MTDCPHTPLLLRFAAGDKQAAQKLCDDLTPRLYRHAMRLTGDTALAEDITQDALLKLWKKAPDWHPGQAKVTTWLFTVTRNLSIDSLRRRHPTENIEDMHISKEHDPTLRLSIEEALKHLPLRQREAIILNHIEGLSNPEIALTLETTVRSVESLLKRGRATLRTLLDPPHD